MQICGDQAIFIPEEPCDSCEHFIEEVGRLDNRIDEKQDRLIPGKNIEIINNVISAEGSTYTAGDNITIENDVISATDTTYAAGDGISINAENTINAERNASNTYTKEEVDALIGALEHAHITEVQTLPATGESNTIYLVPKSGGGHNMFVWDDVNKVFVPVGQDTVDLTGYIKDTDLNTAAKDGIVTKGNGQVNKMWRTDSQGNPAWRDVVIPINPATEPTEDGAIWLTT